MLKKILMGVAAILTGCTISDNTSLETKNNYTDTVAASVAVPVVLQHENPNDDVYGFWVDVAVPKAFGDALPSIATFVPDVPGPTSIAMKGRTLGTHTTMFHVQRDMLKNTAIHGTITDTPQTYSWQWSPWVNGPNNPITRFLSSYTIDLGSGPLTFPFNTFEIKELGARQVFMNRYGPVQGFWVEEYVYFYSEQEVIPMEIRVTWSDRNDITWGPKDVTSFTLNNAVPFVGVHATELGIGNSIYDVPTNRWNTVLQTNQSMHDGQSMAFYGFLLGFPADYFTGGIYNSPEDLERLETLDSVRWGYTLGACKSWSGHWGPWGSLPETPQGNPSALIWPFKTTGSLYQNRAVGCLPSPGGTGSQEDFGATKGSAVTVQHNPKWIHWMKNGTADLFRCVHNIEIDGTILKSAIHPGWSVFGMKTHCATSSDTLGKDCGLWNQHPHGVHYSPPTFKVEWDSWDDQHRSTHNLWAFYALTGSHMVENEFLYHVQLDVAMVNGRMGAARAIGRLFKTWANLYLVMDPVSKQAILNRVYEKLTNVENQWTGRNFTGNPATTVRVMTYSTDPRLGVTDPVTGQPVPAWVVWQEAIAAVGLESWYRITQDNRFRDVARHLCRNVILNGYFEDPTGTWNCADQVRYLTGAQEGYPMPPSSYYLGSPEVACTNWFWEWTSSVCILARTILSDEPAIVQRAEQILASHYGGFYDNWNHSEFMAVGSLNPPY